MLILLPLQAVRFIFGCIQRLLPELREHPGGLSPLFLIKMKFGKTDFNCDLVKVMCRPVEASLVLCLFGFFAMALMLGCEFILLRLF